MSMHCNAKKSNYKTTLEIVLQIYFTQTPIRLKICIQRFVGVMITVCKEKTRLGLLSLQEIYQEFHNEKNLISLRYESI